MHVSLSIGNFSFSSWYVSLSPSTVSAFPLMRPAPPWWWDRQRVIKVKSHLVEKLTSIRTILPRWRSPPFGFPQFIPATQYIPDSHPPSFILTDPLPHHVSALHLSSSLLLLLLSFLIFPYPVSVITLNLSSLAVLFCDGVLRKFSHHQFWARKLILSKSLLFRKCLVLKILDLHI